MTLKNAGVVVAIAVALVAVLIALSGPKTVETVVEKYRGAGPTFSSRAYFQDNMEVGGAVFATSSVGSVTYPISAFTNFKLVRHIAASAVTATLPTAASLQAAGFLKNPGDSTVTFIHASTTRVTLAAGTGIKLRFASTSPTIAPDSTARLEWVKLPADEANQYSVMVVSQ